MPNQAKRRAQGIKTRRHISIRANTLKDCQRFMMKKGKYTCMERIGAYKLTMGSKPNKFCWAENKRFVHHIDYRKPMIIRKFLDFCLVNVVAKDIFENKRSIAVNLLGFLSNLGPI